MRAQIRNLRGVKSADLDIGKIVLVGGDNGAGKSSTLGALAAALTGRGMPEGFTKSSAIKLVRDGAEDGFVMLEGPNGKTSVPYPSLEVVGNGRAPFASQVSAGLSSILDMDAKERAKALISLLKAEPSRDDLAAALAEIGILPPEDPDQPFDILDQIWSKIDSKAWDGAHQDMVARGAKLKGAWEEVTGKKYGKVAAEGWSPEGWLPEFAAETVETATERLETARSALETAVTVGAVDTAERERRAASADRVDDLVEQVAAAQTSLDQAHAAATKAADDLAALPAGVGYSGLPCPHCGGKVVTYTPPGGGIMELRAAAPHMTDDEVKRQRMARAGAEGTLSNLRGAVGAKQTEFGRIKGDLATAQADAEWLVANPAREVAEDAVPTARQAVADAERLVRLITAKQRAAGRHAETIQNQSLIDLLAPNGLRQKKLSEVSDLFNTGRLAPLCAAAKWLPVCVTADLGITYGGRTFVLLSASEQWRVRVIVQIATAQLDGSELILIDAADILSPKRRNGLFGMLAGLQIPVVVAMTAGVPDKLPDLAAAGLGMTYWLADGVAMPLASVAVKKAA